MRYVETDSIIANYMPDKADDTDATAAIDDMNLSVSEFIDSYCNRREGYFLPAGDTATARNFRGAGKHFLQIAKHVPGSVTVDGMESEQFYENENNGWIYANNLVTNGVFSNSDISDNRFFGYGVLYVVRAKWGYAATPRPIQEAVKQIVARWFDVQNGVFGQVTPGGFLIERDMPPSAKSLLQSYIKREFEID